MEVPVAASPLRSVVVPEPVLSQKSDAFSPIKASPIAATAPEWQVGSRALLR